MATRLKGKQIDQLVGQGNNKTGLTIPSASTLVVTSQHSGDTAGGSNTQAGVITTAPYNKVYIRNNTTGKAFEDASQRQVYGRLTESSGVWTISFYVLITGVETAYNFNGTDDAGETFDYTYFEVVQIGNSDPRNVVNLFENIDEINSSNPLNHSHIIDPLTVTAQNVISDLSQVPKDTNDVKLEVNTAIYLQGVHFTVSGQTITWTFTSGSGGFNIETTDTVTAFYEY